MFTEKTRVKMALLLVAVIAVEGVIKALLPAFPYEAAIAAQLIAGGGYSYLKTKDNQAWIKLSHGESGA